MRTPRLGGGAKRPPPFRESERFWARPRHTPPPSRPLPLMGAPPPVRDVLGQSGAGSRGEFVPLSGPKGALRRKPGQKPLGSAPEVAVRGGLRTRSRSVLGQPVDRPLGGSTVPDGSSRSGAVTPTVKVGGSIFEVSKTMNPLEGTNSGHSNSRCHSWSTCHVPGGAKCSACARMCSMAMNQV
ncbi:PREDICTED: uncharacterized protein LOC105581270 isoform X5 [Cercocebus atys]|uniref:uncharacterized protein LOC105581270 isoform X5 n=1 Tax=Cercocebus atys TaxID=9531 RepID=UPI0005F39561|nr:PREDICTED: uncharacterized protein LOC105581270 isoform X5 [Cercocebus atys]XP_011905676.1 PREDICTED: uncharacterized protein LOC105581270 isoform X5 [Cercocebus atys]